MEDSTFQQHLYTCLSCSIAFLSPEEQRVHYRSDFHRYNMKRRVASLPPVTTTVFDSKLLERRAETAIVPSTRDLACRACNRVYTSEGAYKSHINSKKHKENENGTAKASTRDVNDMHLKTTQLPHDNSPDDLEQTLDEKIATARSRLSPSHCLFCDQMSASLEGNLLHMSQSHSFFIPDIDYLTDLPGLLTYLGEKVAVGNVCIFCNEKGREFRSLDAVRKHMTDKSHCKIAYDSPDDRLEISDFYDFTSSYPDAELRRHRKAKKENREAEDDQADWEDVENDSGGSVDEIVDNVLLSDGSDLDSEDDLPESNVAFGHSDLELVLPSGARIGHRSIRRYHARPLDVFQGNKPEFSNSGAALVRRLLTDKNSNFVPRKGGFGAFGSGTDLVKARNRGEAREAGRHVREYRDQRRREEFKTKVAFIANSQKHYRDPLLQVLSISSHFIFPYSYSQLMCH